VIDTVLDLDDFLKVFYREGGIRDDIRICVKQEGAGEMWVKCQVVVSGGIYSLVTGQPRKVLQCIVSQRVFNYHFLTSPYENKEKKEYKEWVEAAYNQVEEKLGFKPIEGYWSFETKK